MTVESGGTSLVLLAGVLLGLVGLIVLLFVGVLGLLFFVQSHGLQSFAGLGMTISSGIVVPQLMKIPSDAFLWDHRNKVLNIVLALGVVFFLVVVLSVWGIGI